MRGLLSAGLIGGLLAGSTSVWAEETAAVRPLITQYGSVVPMPDAAEPPRKGVKIVLDVVTEAKKADELNAGIERAARYLNLNALAGHAPSDVRLTIVLHGPATIAALDDAAYKRRTQIAGNPNLPLIRELRKHGVDVFVCGQALARHKFAVAEVAQELTVAVSAMTALVNRQQDGYAYLSIH